MKRWLSLLCLIPCILLSGCSRGVLFSNYRELHQTQLVQTMGLDKSQGTVSVTVASAATKTREAEAFTGKAPTIIHALSNIHSYPAKQFLFYGHTGNLLLGGDMVEDISECLDFIERSVDMRLDTALFVVRDYTAEEVIRRAKVGQNSVTELLEPLSEEASLGALNHMFTAKELIGSLTAEGVGLAYAVTLSETEGITKEGEVNIIPDGYAIIKDKKTVGYIENEDCIGVNLLLGLGVNEIIDVPDPSGAPVSLSLIYTNSDFSACWEDEELKSLKYSFKISANIEQAVGEPDLGNREVIKHLENSLALLMNQKVSRGVELARQNHTDFLGFRKQVEVADPIKYNRIRDNWDELFYSLPVDYDFDIVIERTYDIVDASEDN